MIEVILDALKLDIDNPNVRVCVWLGICSVLAGLIAFSLLAGVFGLCAAVAWLGVRVYQNGRGNQNGRGKRA